MKILSRKRVQISSFDTLETRFPSNPTDVETNTNYADCHPALFKGLLSISGPTVSREVEQVLCGMILLLIHLSVISTHHFLQTLP